VDGGVAVGGTGAVRVTGATVSGDKYSYRKRGAQPGGAHRERSGRAAERRAGGWRGNEAAGAAPRSLLCLSVGVGSISETPSPHGVTP